MRFELEAFGHPATKGNMTAFCPRRHKGCRPIVTEATHDTGADDIRRCDKLKAWIASIQHSITEIGCPPPIEGPASVTMVFAFEKPKTVKVRDYPDNRSTPDVDKLARAVLDAIQSHAGPDGAPSLLTDDAQVARLVVYKVWADEGDAEGVSIYVEPLAAGVRPFERNP